MDQIQYKLKAESNGNLETIQSGLLEDIDGNLYETKSFWNGSPAYKNPTVFFTIGDKEESLRLALTEKGYGETRRVRGMKLGCNMNRVRNQKSRWGLTVWIEIEEIKVAS